MIATYALLNDILFSGALILFIFQFFLLFSNRKTTRGTGERHA